MSGKDDDEDFYPQPDDAAARLVKISKTSIFRKIHFSPKPENMSKLSKSCSEKCSSHTFYFNRAKRPVSPSGVNSSMQPGNAAKRMRPASATATKTSKTLPMMRMLCVFISYLQFCQIA